MKSKLVTVFTIITTMCLVATAIAGDAALTITEDEKEATVDCTATPVISVDASNNKLTVTGECRSISLNGSRNTVTAVRAAAISINGEGNAVGVDSVKAVDINGNDNRVRWQTPYTKKSKPRVSRNGFGNSVKKGKL